MAKKRGFTLIELLVVIAIISILVAVGIPAYIGQQTRAARNEAYTNLESLRLLEEQFFAENGEYAPRGGGTINYNASPYTDDNGIEDALRGFKPASCLIDDADPTPCAAPFGLNYTYTITSVDTDGDGSADAFTATATGFAGTRVAGDVFTVDQNNVRNF